MYCTETEPAIATSNENSVNVIQLKKPKSKKNSVRPQIEPVIKTDALDFVAKSTVILESLFEQGRYLAERKRLFNPFEYKCFLGETGCSIPVATKLIKLVQTFGDMGEFLLRKVAVETLKALCVPKYREIVERMRGREDLTDILVRQWMKEIKPPQKTQKRTYRLEEGWQRTADGARCFQIAPIHNEQIGLELSQLALDQNLLPRQVVEKLVEKEYEFVTAQSKIQQQIGEDADHIARAMNWAEVEESVEKDNDRFCKAIAEYTKKKKWELLSHSHRLNRWDSGIRQRLQSKTV